MKKLITLLLIAFVASFASALSGGPDAYGYVWADSDEIGGPTYNWIDITGSGTLVTGLTDDNSVAFIPMGMDFHYYWGDYNQVKIGSNGWVGFENISNIASCFPSIPSAGGAGDTYLAPLMSDLVFNAAGSTPDVYYEYDAVNDRFIISYIDVPWWSATGPGYVGSNSFQIILNNADSSIVYQYQVTDPANYTPAPGCNSAVVGIEGPTGTLGLMPYLEALPPSNYAIKFTYPPTVLLAVPDIKANWHLNADNGAEFGYVGTNVGVLVNLSSVGNVNVTSAVTATIEIRNAAMALVGSSSINLSTGLNFGTDSTTTFIWTPTTAGQFSITTVVSNIDDINATNNTLVTEIEIIDPMAAISSYKYVNATDVAMGSLAWSGGVGQGAGVYIEPNDYPFVLESIGAFFTGAADGCILEVFADDGAGGFPGTLLHTETLLSGNVVVNAWNTSTLSAPIIITSGGFYVSWKNGSFGSLQLGTVTSEPISRRSFEYLGAWEVYRDNTVTDLMLEANGYSSCGSFLLTVDETENVDCFGGTDGSIDVTVSGGTMGYTYSWTGGVGAVEDPAGLAAGLYILTVTDSLGCTRSDSVTITEPSQISLSATSTDEILGNDGTIDLTATGGTSPYTFSWTNGAGTIEDPLSLSAGIYTVTVTDSAGCIDSLTVTVGSQVGLYEVEILAQWTLYPNPSNGTVSISIEEGLIVKSIDIVNVLGQSIQSVSVDELTSIELNDSGVYYVVLSTSIGKSIKKLIVN